MNQIIVTWFGHIIRIDGGRLIKKNVRKRGDYCKGKGRPERRYIKGVQEFFDQSDLIFQEDERRAKDIIE